MKTLVILVKRNIKLFFKDKGMFFTSLITPAILLVLYVTFLADVYRDAFAMSVAEGVKISEKLIDGCVGGQLFSSLLSVSCVTVAFCSNFLMVQDKTNGARNDMLMAPIKKTTLALGYYIATTVATLIVCYFATAICFAYLAVVGWYFSFTDVILILVDVFLLVMFGTALSSIINYFLTSQGQMSAVGTIVSSGYGFICGAYMPISQFGEGLQTVLSFLPGTYGTALFRNHTMRGAFQAMLDDGIPLEAIESMKNGVDCSFQFLGQDVTIEAMYGVLIGSIILLLGVYILINVWKGRTKKSSK